MKNDRRKRIAGYRLCRACGLLRASKARGLCYRCYSNPEVLAKHPPAVVRCEDHYGGTHLPLSPTTALPGSEEKILALAARAEQGVCLHHPQDARRPSGDQPNPLEVLLGAVQAGCVEEEPNDE